MNPLLIPLAPIAGFCCALAIAFFVSSFLEHREHRAIRVRPRRR